MTVDCGDGDLTTVEDSEGEGASAVAVGWMYLSQRPDSRSIAGYNAIPCSPSFSADGSQIPSHPPDISAL